MPPRARSTIEEKMVAVHASLVAEVVVLRRSDNVEDLGAALMLMDIARQLSSSPVREVLEWLPRDGTWALGTGPYAKVISHMLDEGTALIEEVAMPEDVDCLWRVRLTQTALAMLA